MDAVETFWQKFLRETGRGADTCYFDCFHFELSERPANELFALVLAGRKKATASSLHCFETLGLTVPKPRNLSIVTDWDGNPKCVIETTAVTILPFRDITFDICRREGEDDCLESWQRGHRRFFSGEGRELGYAFSEDMPVVFEDFEVIYKV